MIATSGFGGNTAPDVTHKAYQAIMALFSPNAFAYFWRQKYARKNNRIMDEIFDIVDENDNIIGQASRKEAHSNPNIIHRVVHLAVLNSEGEILAFLRSKKKKFGGGKWQLFFGGHVDSGEDPLDAAPRELEEELGIKAKPMFLGKHLFKYPTEQESSYFFVVKHNGPFTFNEEVDEVKFIPIDKIHSLPDWNDYDYEEKADNYDHIWVKLIIKNWDEIHRQLKIVNCTLTNYTTTPSGE